jgi:hypothetical protein
MQYIIIGMLFCEHVTMSVSRWAWRSEHDQIFFRIFCPHSWNIWRIFLTHGIEYLVMCRNILPRIHGWMIFMDENVDEKNGWTFLWTLATYFFCKKLNNRNKMEEIYVGLFWQIRHMKCLNHISTCTSYFLNMKYIQALQHLNHIIFKIKSNLVAYKPIDPPRGMCPLGIETIWGSPWHLTLSTYHLKLFFIFIHSFDLLHLGPFLLLV